MAEEKGERDMLQSLHRHWNMVAVVRGFTLLFLIAAFIAGCATPKGVTVAQRRDYVQQMRTKTLNDLYQAEPQTKEKIKKAAGYGVFNNIGTNIIFVSTGGGFGVVHNNSSGDDVYMRMGEAGVGLGLGLKDFRAVFIFNNKQTLHDFIITGWEFGGEADAAAKAGDQGAEVSSAASVDSIQEDVEIYQITENGIALSATISGTKYWWDKELN
jgi:lipid-binding SYLF domain-containing protein